MNLPDVQIHTTRRRQLVRRHLLVGWCSLLSFALLGIWLELMHGFKVAWYLDEAYSTRRLMWTLGHAHGVLLALVQIAFAGTLPLLQTPLRFSGLTSWLLTAATLLMPVGFFLGGIFIYGGDPGFGIWLVPVGALCLLAGLSLTVCSVAYPRHADAGD